MRAASYKHVTPNGVQTLRIPVFVSVSAAMIGAAGLLFRVCAAPESAGLT